ATGQLTAAAGLYAKALALRPAWSEGRLALATVLVDLKRYGEARDHLQRLTSAGQSGGEAWALLGITDSRLRDYEAALSALDRARAGGASNTQPLSVGLFERALLPDRAGPHEAAPA